MTPYSNKHEVNILNGPKFLLLKNYSHSRSDKTDVINVLTYPLFSYSTSTDADTWRYKKQPGQMSLEHGTFTLSQCITLIY